jgi:hypothetical protein
MFVASRRLNGPLAVAMDTTMGTAVLASAATVRRQAGARQALLALSIKNNPLQPLFGEIAPACLN